MAAATTAPTGQASILVQDLTKMYGDFRALHGISFSVQPGEIVGFLGPNGAGKTTTMKILTCFMSATSGEAQVAGHDVRQASEQVRRRIGYLPENVPLYEEMLVYDYLAFIAELRGVPSGQRREAIRRTALMTGLEVKISSSIGELSKGYRQRVGLAQAIIHEPDVVILDEPTTGLDPNQILEIREVIKTIGQEKTVLFSTHIMQEVSAVCDRVIILNQGAIVADDTVAGLQAEVAARKPGLLVTLEASASSERLRARLAEIDGVSSAVVDDARASEVTLRLEARDLDAVRAEVFLRASRAEIAVKRVGPYEPSLEESFRVMTGGATEENLGGSTAQAEEE